ncbi:mucosal addressin cell adhesion molecule 1 isoform X2 [Theropithecus gelada]|uniref:mucosal addressin cell adhesion molecule 1 isoform X2 n=1 Tax=Theropithecus gelada TaxID=9565 RepID=UPI000DC18FA4|nr:mucosal addressin cell adhesion molecule 1 isoform X2 [Theropithecus gelada]
MDWGLALLLAGLLGLLQPGCGQSLQVKPLQVEPPEPVVAVALGASRQLTCRLDCADRGATVQWRGLDTSLGAVQSDAGRSVLTVRNASLSAAGTRVCVGSCGGRTFQHTVRLLVYAFPDQLTISPAALVPGDPEVACTAHKVMPVDPNALSFSLLLGDQELEGAQALGPEVEEEEPQEEEDVLFRVTERWRLPTLATPVLPALYCQATMRLPGLELSHRQAIPVLHSPTSREPPDTTSREPQATTSPEPQTTTSPDPQTTTSPEPQTTTSPEPQAAATSPEPQTTTSPESQAATSLETTPQQGSTHSPRSPGSTRTCCPEISQAGPTQGEVIPTGSSKPTGDQLPTALWTSSAVLGLLLLALPTYHLWKRCRHLAEDGAHPPASLRLLPQVSTWAGLRGTDQVGSSPF